MATKIVTTTPSTTWAEASSKMFNGIKSALLAHGGWTIETEYYDNNQYFYIQCSNLTQLIDGEPIRIMINGCNNANINGSSILAGFVYTLDGGVSNNTVLIDGNAGQWTSPQSTIWSYGMGLGMTPWKIMVSDRYLVAVSNENNDFYQGAIFGAGDVISYFNSQGLTGNKKQAVFAGCCGNGNAGCSQITRYGYDDTGTARIVETSIINNRDNISKNVNVERGQYELLMPAQLYMYFGWPGYEIGYLGELLPGRLYKIQQPISYIGVQGTEGIVNGHTYKRAIDTNGSNGNGSVRLGRVAVLWEETT